MRKDGSNTGPCVNDERAIRPLGVTDSIESYRDHGTTRRRARLLGDELPEYPLATPSGSRGDGLPSGMGNGLAVKRGNARGVKVPTYQHPLKEKQRRYTESETSDGN